MKMLCRPLLSYSFGFILLCASLSLQAQNPAAIHDKEMLDSLFTAEHLDTLPGLPVTLYTHGYTVRAKAIQALVSSCITFYHGLFPMDSYAVQIEIINEKDWKTLPFPHPYGFPHFTDVNQSIIVAADKNALNKLNKLSDQISADSTTEGYDYVALHELGHYFFFTLHQINKERWLNETLASYYMICYLKQFNLRLDIGKENPSYSPQHRSIADFEQLYIKVGPQNYDWYQRRFIDLDFLLYPQLKTNLIKEVINNYGAGGKNIDGMTLFKNLEPATMDLWLKNMQ